MELTLSEDLKTQLSLLTSQDTSVIQEFCRLVNQYYKQEINPRIFNSAANKLGVQSTQVEDAVRALAFLFIHCTQVKASRSELQDLALSLNFTDEAVNILLNAYTNNENDLREYLKTMEVQVPRYKNLEWRFDILVGSRTLHHIAEPVITLCLSHSKNTGTQCKGSYKGDGDENGDCDKLILQTDPNNLQHMTSVLEEALQEATTHHARRVQRYLK